MRLSEAFGPLFSDDFGF